MKRILGALLIVLVVAVALIAQGPKVYTAYQNTKILHLTDTMGGIDTGRIGGFDSTTAARTLVKVKAGVGDTTKRSWIKFKPNLSMDVESTGKGPFTFTIDSLSGQFPDSGFRFTYVKASYTGVRQSGFVNWKYTIKSDSTSFVYNARTNPSAGGDETIVWDTGDVFQIPPANSYFVQFACYKMSEKDSTGARMILQNRMYMDSRPGDNWANVCSSGVFTDTTAPLADTAKITRDNLGEAFRVIAWMLIHRVRKCTTGRSTGSV